MSLPLAIPEAFSVPPVDSPSTRCRVLRRIQERISQCLPDRRTRESAWNRAGLRGLKPGDACEAVGTARSGGLPNQITEKTDRVKKKVCYSLVQSSTFNPFTLRKI